MSNPIRPPQLSNHMKSMCRKLRKESTVPERILWSLLRNRNLDDLKFRRQQVIGPFIVDFYCDEMKLVVELDGESHAFTQESDKNRQHCLKRQGLKVIRFLNDDVLQDLEAVCLEILKQAGRIDDHSPSP